MDRKKIITICLILVAVFLYLVASLLSEAVFNALDEPVKSGFFQLVSIPDLIGVAVGLVGFVVALKNASLIGFLDECLVELIKVVYPTPRESGQSGIVVVVMVGVATLILAVFDYVWWLLTRLVLG